MKTCLSLLVSVVSVLLIGAQTTWACQSLPESVPAYRIFENDLKKILSATALHDELEKVGIFNEDILKNIQSIQLGKPFRVQLIDGCEFDLVPDSANSPVGTCESLLPLKAANKKSCK